jgi:transcription elongation factor Elf1
VVNIKFEFNDIDIEKLLSEAPLDLPCPNCDGKLRVSINQIKRHDTVICPNCGAHVELRTT